MKIPAILKISAAALAISISLYAADGQSPGKAETGKTAHEVKAGHKDIDPATFDQLRRNDTNTVVLDVRTKKEYREGHIPGAVLLDFNSPNFDEEVAKLDKSKTYLVHCAAGGRSTKACKKMERLDFSKLYNLEGGMGAWKKAGKPVEK